MRPSFHLLLTSLVLAGCGANLTHPTRFDAGGPLACLPNLDGRIDSNELAPVLGVPATYLVSPSGATRTVDLAGRTDAAGHLVWDFSAPAAGDQRAAFTAEPLVAQWYAPSFPGGQFVVPADSAGTLDGVYAHDAQGLWFLGIASSTPSPPEGETLLAYQHPVALYRFPLTTGMSWTEVGTITSGTLRGLPYVGQDTYQIQVDASGEVDLPAFTVTQAFRVHTTITQQPAAGAPVVTRQVSFLFECLGEIARFTSRPGETAADFTVAAEVRRLTLSP